MRTVETAASIPESLGLLPLSQSLGRGSSYTQGKPLEPCSSLPKPPRTKWYPAVIPQHCSSASSGNPCFSATNAPGTLWDLLLASHHMKAELCSSGIRVNAWECPRPSLSSLLPIIPALLALDWLLESTSHTHQKAKAGRRAVQLPHWSYHYLSPSYC